MNLNNLYEAIIELQYELSGQHHDAEIGCLDYKVIKWQQLFCRYIVRAD